MLKLQSISNDHINRTAVIRFADVLDDQPQISVTINLATSDEQTQAEVQNAVKRVTRSILSEAVKLCI